MSEYAYIIKYCLFVLAFVLSGLISRAIDIYFERIDAALSGEKDILKEKDAEQSKYGFLIRLVMAMIMLCILVLTVAYSKI